MNTVVWKESLVLATLQEKQKYYVIIRDTTKKIKKFRYSCSSPMHLAFGCLVQTFFYEWACVWHWHWSTACSTDNCHTVTENAVLKESTRMIQVFGGPGTNAVLITAFCQSPSKFWYHFVFVFWTRRCIFVLFDQFVSAAVQSSINAKMM